MVRIGLAIFGLYASEATREALPLRLAISLTTKIVGINTCHEGETISYGRRFRVEKRCQRIAVLPLDILMAFIETTAEKALSWCEGKEPPWLGRSAWTL